MLDGTTVVPRVWSQTQCLIDLLFSGTPESTIFHVILPGTSDGFYKFTPWARVNPTILNIACFSQSVLPWSKKEVDPCLHFLGCSISGSKMTSGWVVYILQSGLIAFLIKSSLYWSICFFFLRGWKLNAARLCRANWWSLARRRRVSPIPQWNQKIWEVA